jgi:hypothetical protein
LAGSGAVGSRGVGYEVRVWATNVATRSAFGLIFALLLEETSTQADNKSTAGRRKIKVSLVRIMILHPKVFEER